MDLDIISNTTTNESNNYYIAKRSTVGVQSISNIKYIESLSEIQNPYRGFFKQLKITLNRNGKSKSGSIPKTNLVRILVDMSDFQRYALDEKALSYLRNIFEQLKSSHKSFVIRFAYDPGYSGSNTKEPSIEMVLKHQEGLRKLLGDYADSIGSVECGLFGAYGEMHSSSVYKTDEQRKNYVVKTIEKWLDVLPSSITLSVRTPEFYCDWSKINRKDLSNNITKAKQSAYRVGIYNDGYLASYSDLGTFRDREAEIKWLSNQAKHTLYGGEFGKFKNKEMKNVEHSSKYMEKEAFLTHTSYLNLGWYKDTVEQMKKEQYSGTDKRYKGKTGFQYIENHLGYRFVVRGVRLTKSAEINGKFGLEVDIENVGFANLIKPKSIILIMVGSNNTSYRITNLEILSNGNPSNWDSKKTSTFKSEVTLPSGMGKGNYKAYIRIASSRSSKGLSGYPIRFANDDKNIWDNSLGANYLGEFTVVGNAKNSNKATTNNLIENNKSTNNNATTNNATKNNATNNNATINNATNNKTSSSSTNNKYATLKFKGKLDNTTNFYLGVKELKEHKSFNIYESNETNSGKYRTWHVTSQTSPSLFYLSNGTYGNEGKPSNYCLDLGNYKNDNGLNYLSIVECSKAQHKFMYGGTFSDSIDVYNINGKHLTDGNGNKLCLYYSMTPRIAICKNPSTNKNIGWAKHSL
eukprot:jgi/Orpsp1_1/1183475/evm.model.c7180000085370.1